MHINKTGLIGLLSVTLVAGCLDPSEDGNLVPKTVDEDPTLPQLAFNGSRFHLEAFGNEADPVVIMLHGGPGSDYRSMLGLRMAVDGQRLEDTHRVVFWDQRGSGLSQRHDADDFDIGIYNQDLDWLIEHFSPGRPVVLVGHSWGGMYASAYISEHPSKVAGAVLIEPGPLTGDLFEDIKQDVVNFDLFGEWLNDFTWAQSVISPDDHARADFLRLVGMLSHDLQPDFGDTETPLFWREGAVANTAMQNDGLKDGKGVWDFTTGLDEFTTPVLFMASERNTVIGEQFQRRQLGFYPNADLIVIQNSGHEVPFTQPEATLRAILSYLGEINL